MAWRPVARGMQQQQRMRLAPLRASIPNEADALYKGIPLASGLINKRLMQKQASFAAGSARLAQLPAFRRRKLRRLHHARMRHQRYSRTCICAPWRSLCTVR